MSDKDIVRAWKDDEYRRKLASQGQAVPGNPAGEEELSDEDLQKVAGGLPMSHGHAAPGDASKGVSGDPTCRDSYSGGTGSDAFDCQSMFSGALYKACNE